MSTQIASYPSSPNPGDPSAALDIAWGDDFHATHSSRFKHYHKPTVSDSPELVELCRSYIDSGNIAELAKVARNRGLPPALRQYAWPLLLESHPYVQHPSIVAEFPGSGSGSFSGPSGPPALGVSPSAASAIVDPVPSRRIRGDISRYRKKLNKSRLSKLHADGLSTRTTASTEASSHYMSSISTPTISPCGSDGASTPIRSTSGQSSSTSTDADPKSLDPLAYFTDSVENERFQIIEDAIEQFLVKWGSSIPYESGMAWVAFALAEWVDPVCEMGFGSPVIGSNLDSTTTTPELKPIGVWEPSPAPFATIFEHMMLVMFHSPGLSGDGPSGPCDSPLSQRVSIFLTVIRKLMPDLTNYFDEEDVLSSIGGDEWLLWWVKWMGSKVWNRHDRARVWDMYLGWRDNTQAQTLANNNLNEETDVSPFWCPPSDTDEPVAPVDLHTQHLFVCIAILKSKSNTLLELDQSEIRQMLTHLHRCNDMESVVDQAGGAWRSWYLDEEANDDV